MRRFAIMTKDERLAIYKRAVKHFGQDSQIVKLIEELAELQQMLCKFLISDSKFERGKLIDEMADANIMIEQITDNLMIDDEVKTRIDYKLLNLLKRLQMEGS